METVFAATPKRTTMQRRGFLAGVCGAVTGALAGCSGGTSSATSTTTDGASTGTPASGTVAVDLVDYKFVPGTDSPLRIEAGTTVTFVWKSGGHDIHVDSQPDGANWQGVENLQNAGYTTEHTFSVPGHYHFWCRPHRGLGMVGDFEVVES